MAEHTTGEEWQTEKEATCAEKGVKVQMCTVCGSVLNREVIDETGHTGEWGIAENPITVGEGINGGVFVRFSLFAPNGNLITSEDVEIRGFNAKQFADRYGITMNYAGGGVKKLFSYCNRRQIV